LQLPALALLPRIGFAQTQAILANLSGSAILIRIAAACYADVRTFPFLAQVYRAGVAVDTRLCHTASILTGIEPEDLPLRASRVVHFLADALVLDTQLATFAVEFAVAAVADRNVQTLAANA